MCIVSTAVVVMANGLVVVVGVVDNRDDSGLEDDDVVVDDVDDVSDVVDFDDFVSVSVDMVVLVGVETGSILLT